MLHPRTQVDDEPAVVVPRIFIVHPLFDIDIDTADGIDNFLKGMGVDDDIVIDAHAEEILDGRLRQPLPAVSIGGVDLVIPVLRDRHARVARDRE